MSVDGSSSCPTLPGSVVVMVVVGVDCCSDIPRRSHQWIVPESAPGTEQSLRATHLEQS